MAQPRSQWWPERRSSRSRPSCSDGQVCVSTCQYFWPSSGQWFLSSGSLPEDMPGCSAAIRCSSSRAFDASTLLDGLHRDGGGRARYVRQTGDLLAEDFPVATYVGGADLQEIV